MPNVHACKSCRKLFNAFGEEKFCPACVQKQEDKLNEVKDYLWEKKVASMHEISQACDVPVDQLKDWLRQERLSLADGATDLTCEKCGKPILSGRYCPDCKKEMMDELKSVAPKDIKVVSVQKATKERDRMRFLDSH